MATETTLESPDCCDSCYELTERQFPFHLLVLMIGTDEGPKSLEEAYLQSGYSSGGTSGARRSSASQLKKSPKVAEAIQHHMAIESERYSKTKDASIERMVATCRFARFDHFAKIDTRKVEIGHGEDAEVVEVDSLTLEPTREIEDPEMFRALSKVDLHPNGMIKSITVRDPGPNESRLAEILGWKRPETQILLNAAEWEDLERRAAAGDGDAIEHLRRLGQPGG